MSLGHSGGQGEDCKLAISAERSTKEPAYLLTTAYMTNGKDYAECAEQGESYCTNIKHDKHSRYDLSLLQLHHLKNYLRHNIPIPPAQALNEYFSYHPLRSFCSPSFACYSRNIHSSKSHQQHPWQRTARYVWVI